MEAKERKTGRRKAGKRSRRIWTAVLGCAVLAMALAAVLLLRPKPAAPKVERETEPEVVETLSLPTEQETAVPTEPETEPEPEMLPSMKELYERNSDIAGWIKIEGTAVDYPVMYTPEDGEYYLFRTFEKEEDPAKQGCLFIDEHCQVEPRSTNLLVHGHNMKNGTMFRALLGYKEEEFYKEHPVIQYTTLYEEETYEIIAVFRSQIFRQDEDVFKYYHFFDAGTKEEFDEYVENCKALARYETGVTAQYGDEILTLSTCDYYTENGRLVVVARKRKVLE
jgi:sortase B